MATNSEPSTHQVVRFCRVGCSEWVDKLRVVLGRSDIGPFQITRTVEDILAETFIRCFNGFGRTLVDILQDLRKYKVDRRDVMDILIDFEDYIYKDSTLTEMRRFTVVDAKFIYDTPLMEVEYHEHVYDEEPESFSRFIRLLRRHGEVIHPEVEKALEKFREQLQHSSTLYRSRGVPLSDRRSRRH